MKYFLDTEFIEGRDYIDLISVGIVCEDDRELYLENSEVDWSRASQWVLDNVRPHLLGGAIPRDEIAAAVLAFTAGTEPEFWAYYAEYDWVVFRWLFGSMMDVPDGYPLFCMDIKQVCAELGNPALPEQSGTEHNALADARWNREALAFMRP